MNEENKIRRCLESVSWCDEIVVVDSGSTDQTLVIAGEFNARIFHRPWPGYVAQKGFGLAQCQHEWVLNLDADEVVSEPLREELLTILERDAKGEIRENGFFLSRVVFYLGRWWRRGGWYPEYRLRFCRRSETTWGGEDPHERALVEGGTGRLGGELLHYTYDSIQDQVRSITSLARVSAQVMHARNRHATILDILGRPIARFFKFYVAKRGFREGFPGLLVACMETWGVFLKYCMLWELTRTRRPQN
jgi:glycosyltransferase involved in cell wall biosynthesis